MCWSPIRFALSTGSTVFTLHTHCVCDRHTNQMLNCARIGSMPNIIMCSRVCVHRRVVSLGLGSPDISNRTGPTTNIPVEPFDWAGCGCGENCCVAKCPRTTHTHTSTQRASTYRHDATLQTHARRYALIGRIVRVRACVGGWACARVAVVTIGHAVS